MAVPGNCHTGMIQGRRPAFPDWFSSMRRLCLLLSLIVAFAGPAPAQGVYQRSDFRPEYVLQFELLPGRVPQGLWRFGNGQYLMTQDIDGGDDREWVRFNLFDKKGNFIRKWEINYGTHGQSMFVKWENGGFTIYTESRNRRGIGIFRLTEERTKLTFVRQVIPKNSMGRTIEFGAFGVDEAEDVIVLGGGQAYKTVQYFKFSDFLNGMLTPLERKIVIQTKDGLDLGWLQGVGTYNGIVYVLTGTSDIKSKKYILRIDEEGNMRRISIGPSRGKALFQYEPESLYVQNGRIMFTMNDHFWAKLYEMKAQ